MSLFRSLIISQTLDSGFAFKGKGTSSSPFLIRSQSDLELLYDFILNDDLIYNNDNVYYALTVNLTLSGFNKSLGNSNHIFKSNFDGRGKEISSLTQALFGYVGNQSAGSVIKNLTLRGSYTLSTLANQAGLANVIPLNYKCVIQNCNNYVEIRNSNASGSSGTSYGHGGFVGLCEGQVDISLSKNYANIRCLSSSTSTRPLSNWGGFIGLVNATGSGSIDSSENLGNVGDNDNTTADGYRAGNYGGFIGKVLTASFTIKNCSNDGTIVCPSNSSGYASGGIVGLSQSSSRLDILNSLNSGIIKGGSKSGTNCILGGIIGQATSGILNVSECKNKGTIKSDDNTTSNTGYFGGILGKGDGNLFNIYGCINDGSITINGNTTSYLGGIVGGQTTTNLSGQSIIDFCINRGILRGVIRYTYVAGIIGYMSNETNTSISVRNCGNENRVSDGLYVGGIVSFTRGGVEPIINSYNISDVMNATDLGGILAHSASSALKIENCYSVYTDMSGGTNTGYIAGSVLNASLIGDVYDVFIKQDVPAPNVVGTSSSGTPSYSDFTGYGNMGGGDDGLLIKLNQNAASGGIAYREWTQEPNKYPRIE